MNRKQKSEMTKLELVDWRSRRHGERNCYYVRKGLGQYLSIDGTHFTGSGGWFATREQARNAIRKLRELNPGKYYGGLH